MRFESPWFLLLLFLVPFLFFVKSRGASIRFSSLTRIKSLKAIKQLGTSPTSWQRYLPVLLRIMAVALIIVAIARPQTGQKQTEILSEGVDIILTIDTSGSMAALDFTVGENRATRLDAVKEVVSKFIDKRPGDRIGMVVFGEEAFTQAPLTLDHALLQVLLGELEIGMAGEATAIGLAMAVSTKRLKDLKAKSKIIILLTDGINNAGHIDPIKAAEIAGSYGVKIYTIGVGSTGQAPFLVEGFFGRKIVYERVNLDEKTLKEVASITDARYFNAKNTEDLEEIYEEIDKLEKSEAKVKEYMNYFELFYWFLIPGIILLLMEIILTRTRLLKIP